METPKKHTVCTEQYKLQMNPNFWLTQPNFSEELWKNFAHTPVGMLDFLQNNMDTHLSKMLQQESIPLPQVQAQKKKRGRKPLRPNDPIRKKTQEKDKYWLRAFRVYMKANFKRLKNEFSSEESEFWVKHLGVQGKPEKGNKFLSYGKRYKNFLFSNPCFVRRFRDWFDQYGTEVLSKKCQPKTNLWVVLYDYAEEELVNYVPERGSSQEEIAVSANSTKNKIKSSNKD